MGWTDCESLKIHAGIMKIKSVCGIMKPASNRLKEDGLSCNITEVS
jgi:hypothetical protein